MPPSISPEDVHDMNYVEFMAFIDETNRPPGGKKAVRELIESCNIRSSDVVLDVGCNTGFVSFELTRVAECDVVAIDLSSKMVKQTKARTRKQYSPHPISCVLGDAQNLPFHEGMFDRVVSGGSTAFIHDRKRALTEYRRVVRNWQFVGEINFYYAEEPPDQLINKLNDRMGTNIEKWKLEDWIELYEGAGFEIYDISTNEIESVPLREVQEYARTLALNKGINKPVQKAIETRLRDLMELFNRNHEYLNYAVITLRKRPVKEQVSLFNP